MTSTWRTSSKHAWFWPIASTVRKDDVIHKTGVSSFLTAHQHIIGYSVPWPQNRKYTTYRNAVKRGPSRGHRQRAQKFLRSLAVWFSSYASEQTGRRTDVLITILRTAPGSEIIIRWRWRLQHRCSTLIWCAIQYTDSSETAITRNLTVWSVQFDISTTTTNLSVGNTSKHSTAQHARHVYDSLYNHNRPRPNGIRL